MIVKDHERLKMWRQRKNRKSTDTSRDRDLTVEVLNTQITLSDQSSIVRSFPSYLQITVLAGGKSIQVAGSGCQRKEKFSDNSDDCA